MKTSLERMALEKGKYSLLFVLQHLQVWACPPARLSGRVQVGHSQHTEEG